MLNGRPPSRRATGSRRRPWRGAAILLALGLSACASRDTSPASSPGPLAGSEWQPVEIGGAAVAPPPEVYLRFQADGQATGLAGCNRFTGPYALDGSAIALGPLAATRMACAPPAMARETAFFAGLDAARSFRRDGVRLVLRDETGAVTMLLRQRDWD